MVISNLLVHLNTKCDYILKPDLLASLYNYVGNRYTAPPL